MANAVPSRPQKKSPPKKEKPKKHDGPRIGEAGEYLPAEYETANGNIRRDN